MVVVLLLALLTQGNTEASATVALNELLIHHPAGALATVESALEVDPDAQILWNRKIEALAELQDPKPLLKALQEYERRFSLTDNVREKAAWALIRAGSLRTSHMMRMRAEYMAAIANDAASIDMLLKGLHDEYLPIRLFSIYLASHYLDEPVQRRLEWLFEQDPAPEVRQAACGALRSPRALPLLYKKLNASPLLEEKESLIRAILQLTRKIEKKDIEKLSESPSSQERELACRLVLEHFSLDCATSLLPLVEDPAERVQVAALETLGALRIAVSFDENKFLTSRSPHLLAGTLSYLLRMGKKEIAIEEKLRELLKNPRRDISLQAVQAIVTSGSQGTQFAEKFIQEIEDPLQQLNLALYLICEEVSVAHAAVCLKNALHKIEERLSFDGDLVVASKLQHVPFMPRYPETLDLLTRLRLSCVLAAVSSENLGALLKGYLQAKNAPLVGMSAALYIQEYEESGIEEIRSLLQDASFEIRMEAAIILGLIVQDEEALKTLYEGFEKAPFDLKEEIIYAIGAIGSSSSLPFLTQCLYKENEALQIAAAGSILQCQNK